jgi:hypothetical protein
MRIVHITFPGIDSEYALGEDGSVYNASKGVYLKGTSITKNNRYVKVHVDKFRPLHRLIAENFIPNPLNLPQVNHKNGNRLDNSVSNLEWCTASRNVQHAYENNLKSNKGSLNPISKLNDDLVRRIRAEKGTHQQVRDRLGLDVGVGCIKAVRTFKNWKHVV